MLIIPVRFRWVFDTLHLCTPSNLGRILDELPISLDYTYERLLQGIPEEKQQYAHRLFRCLVAAMRPLSVEELAEIFAINFESYSAPKLAENPEEDILFTCPSLITITEDKGSKIVQFFPLSVKEFLTSDRLQISEVRSIRHFHISPDGAHTILAQACLTVLLHLGETIDKARLATSPLAFYAAQHWIYHAHFGNVAPQIQDAMKCLFNPRKPYLDSDIRCRFASGWSVPTNPPRSPVKTPWNGVVLCGVM